jgi:CelD/BcsL family acetyltransferase involved in cellulose biosynthesis
MRVERLADLDVLREEWRALAARAGNPFLTWEWASSWWRHYGRGRPLVVLGCRRDDGSLAGILPLYLATSRPLRVLRLVGHTLADRQGAVCAPEERVAVAEALRAPLTGGLGRKHLVVVERLPGSQGWPAMLGGRIVRSEASPSLTFTASDWESFLRARSRNFRDQARRRERRLREHHELAFRLSDRPDRLEADLDTLFDLHDARWEGRGSPGFGPGNRAFHRRFAAQALDAGWLRLWFAEVAGRPVAAWYGFRYGNAEWYYQSGRDPAWDEHAVGFVLLVHTIRAALEDGMATYHLLLGDEAYKRRFASEDEGVETLALATGAAGRAAIAGARLANSAPPSIRGALANAAAFVGLPAR